MKTTIIIFACVILVYSVVEGRTLANGVSVSEPWIVI